MRQKFFRSGLIMACTITTLAVVSCDKADTQKSNDVSGAAAPAPLAALPLANGSAPPSNPAPVASALLPATPVRYATTSPGDRYAYLDRAYSISRAFGDAPPDYTYDYQQQRPLVWRSDDGYQRIAEKLSDGNIRYYYYQPGAQQPYLVQDADYAYGYSNGELTVVYDSSGNIVSDDIAQQRDDIAGRYLVRAEALYAASVREHHAAVTQEYWNQEDERYYADQERWRQQQEDDAAWHIYHDAHRNDEQAHWAMERYRRAAEASRFAQAIANAVLVARANQALSDAAAEARQYGHNVAGPTLPQGPTPSSPRQTGTANGRPAAPPGDAHSQGQRPQPPGDAPSGPSSSAPPLGQGSPSSKPVAAPSHATDQRTPSPVNSLTSGAPHDDKSFAQQPRGGMGGSKRLQSTPPTTARPVSAIAGPSNSDAGPRKPTEAHKTAPVAVASTALHSTKPLAMKPRTLQPPRIKPAAPEREENETAPDHHTGPSIGAPVSAADAGHPAPSRQPIALPAAAVRTNNAPLPGHVPPPMPALDKHTDQASPIHPAATALPSTLSTVKITPAQVHPHAPASILANSHGKSSTNKESQPPKKKQDTNPQ